MSKSKKTSKAASKKAAKAGTTKAAAANAPTKVTKPKRVSALDAAAQVLQVEGQPMASKALIEAMTAKGLWTSPGGKTPHATLDAPMLREINTKGSQARFKKVERGQFAYNAGARA